MVAAVTTGKVDGVELVGAYQGAQLPVSVCASMLVLSNVRGAGTRCRMTDRPVTGQQTYCDRTGTR